ncbi:hypothetical protein SDC9_208745 [bioreactor metagenome]|uniref:DUF4368 domain-containing protein n=1 Tax=bioreactor metagenome TaxID=1076179 RepID=A0A645JBH9_9ZZZZ
MIFSKLYDDNISGKLNDDSFDRLLTAYQREEKQIKEKSEVLVKQAKDNEKSLHKNFYICIEDITEVEELSRELLHQLVDRIEIGQGTYDEKKRKHQVIKIYYKFNV